MYHQFDRPDRCIVGTLGRPGNRTFIVQVVQGGQLAAVVLEKAQAQLLGVRVGEVLDHLIELGRDVPPRQPPLDMGPLDAPVTVDFRVSAIGLAWDQDSGRLVLEFFSEEPDETTGENSLLQVRLTPAMAREFSARAEAVVASGRPACPACGQPLDPEGHICPRANGYRGALFQ